MRNTHLFSNWQTATSTEKKELLQNIISSLGADWQMEGEQLLHTPSDKRFAFIPGGWMTQGLSPKKLYELCTKRKNFDFEDSSWLEETVKMRPAKQVWVYPFLISLEYEKREINAQSPFGFSLPSESELEWVFSNGGQTSFVAENIQKGKKKKAFAFAEPFGIKNLEAVEAQCLDDWHSTLHDKPADSLPWGTGRGVAKDVHISWQDEEEEIIAWHVAYRADCSGSRDHFDVVRLDELFAEKEKEPETESDDFIGEILKNGKAKDKKALIGMLDLLSYTPAEDTPAILEAILSNLETDPKLKPKLLKGTTKIVCGALTEERIMKNSPFSPARELLAEVVDKNLSVLLPLLEISNTVVTKSSVADILSVSSQPEVFDAYLELYKVEKHATVLDSLHIASAFYAKKNAKDKLLFELFDNPKDKSEEYFKVLLQNIKNKADFEQLITPMRNGEVGSNYTFWFISLLLTCDIDKETLGLELAKLSIKLLRKIDNPDRHWCSVYPILEIIDKAFPLVFPKFTVQQSENIQAQKQPCFLFYDDFTEIQKEMLEIVCQAMEISRNNAWHWQRMNDSGIPGTEEGIKIMMGTSLSVYAQKVTYNGMEMPAFYAVATIMYEKKWGEYKQVLNQFLSQFDLETLIAMKFTSLHIYIDSDIRSAIIEKIHEDRPKAANFFKNRLEAAISSGEELPFISFSVLAFWEDHDLRLWLLEHCNKEYEINDYIVDNTYYSIEEATVYQNVTELGGLLIDVLRTKKMEPYVDQFLIRNFANIIIPQTDQKLVMGMLAIQQFCGNNILIEKLETGKSNFAGSEKSKDYTAEEMKPLYNAIPQEYFGDDKKLAFEKLWQIFTEDEDFKL